MTYAWTQKNASLPAQMNNKDGIAGVVLNDKMYALGGWQSGGSYGYSNNNVMHSVDGITWTPSAKIPTWSGRHAFPAVAHNGRIYVLGGDQNSAAGYVADCHSWDGLETSEWVQHATPPWETRCGHVAFSLGGYLWVGFGQTSDWFGATPTKFFTDLWRYDDSTDTWELFSNEMPITPRGYFANALPVLDGEVYFICGASYETSDFGYRDYRKDVWAMDAAGKVRQVLINKKSNLPNIMYHNVVVFDDKLWLIAGYAGADQQAWYMSADKGKTWTQQPTPPWGARHAALAIVYNESIYFGTGVAKADMWQLEKISAPVPGVGEQYGATPDSVTAATPMYTIFDTALNITAGTVIDKIGMHKANPGNVTPKIAKLVAGQTLDIVYSGAAQMHNGSGYQDFDIPNFTVPNDGHTYMVGFAFGDNAVSWTNAGNRFMSTGDVTGNGQGFGYYTDGTICTKLTGV